MVASGVFPAGAMRPRWKASTVISGVVSGRLADLRTASAADKNVTAMNGNAATAASAERRSGLWNGGPGVRSHSW